MFKPLSVFIGLRYTGAKRRNHFISFISLISIMGVLLGVAVLILALSVMNGFERELKERVLGMVPHAVIRGYSGIDDWQSLMEEAETFEGVVAAAPFISVQGMLMQRGGTQGVLIQGIDPEFEPKVSIINQHLDEGTKLSDLSNSDESALSGILLGKRLAQNLNAKVGQQITLILPKPSYSATAVVPSLQQFTVVGTFSVGAEMDGHLAYVHLEQAAKLAGLEGRVEGLNLKTDDLFDAPRISNALAAQLPGNYYASNWTRTHGNLFQAIHMQRLMIALMLLIIIAVAAYNIIATLIIVVTDKQSDIAIMRTLGMQRRSVMKIFISQGAAIGLAGTILGAILGILLSLAITPSVAWLERTLNFKVLDARVYFIDYVPSQLFISDVVIVSGITLLLSLAATLYPAFRATRVKPADALRHDI